MSAVSDAMPNLGNRSILALLDGLGDEDQAAKTPPELLAGIAREAGKTLRELAAEIESLRLADKGSSHAKGCWRWRGHHHCAIEEVQHLRSIIDAAARPWTALDPGIPWEGGIDKAMEAACGEIERLRARVVEADREPDQIIEPSIDFTKIPPGHEGEWVVFCDREPIGYGSTAKEALENAGVSEEGYGDVVMAVVPSGTSMVVV